MSLGVQGPTTINSTLVGFVSDPDGRGTLSLLFSCLLTLGLCVWSAVHLNLPEYNESEVHYLYRYLKWSMLGVFGPELVIWAAWRQFISARALTKMIVKVTFEYVLRTSLDTDYSFKGGYLDDDEKRAKKWTMVHSFYAGMGGFAFDLAADDKSNGPRFIPYLRRLHVTPRGIQVLATCGLLPKVPESEITDKSKADGTAKLIACFQVVWMLIQALTRLAIGLPVTPLETNTIGHVLTALINYALWWHKPRMIKEPTILRGDWTREMCAFMYMSSQVSSKSRRGRDLLRDFGVHPEMSEVIYISGGRKEQGELEKPNVEVIEAVTHVSPNDVSTSQDEKKDSSGFMRLRDELPGVAVDQSQKSQDGSHIDTTAKEMRVLRWKLACDAIERFPAIQQRLEFPEFDIDEMRYREALRLYPEMPPKVRNKFKRADQPNEPRKSDEIESFVCISEELVVDRPRNWPGDDLIRHLQGHLIGIILWSASTVYGAVHLAGWNERFPTSIETWFWRGSAAYIVFSGVLWSLLNTMGHLSGSVWWYWYDILASTERRKSHIVIYILCFIGGSLYVVARVYLVGEAFVSLRRLPESVYQSPSWVLTVPHL
ncbi:hypothetical protein FHL15_010073 [Xylaria flabelliformis]|uniref:Uncharacterized protein n=1 Tax=Xylaria flabelliformis TaxID=2512241 RepID=A0A553HM63_9PEZI|nr:hypothetical protein FHL15_010073 [Xylaria flabelliformis]